MNGSQIKYLSALSQSCSITYREIPKEHYIQLKSFGENIGRYFERSATYESNSTKIWRS